jgi:type I restriction enzyme M protein
MWNQDWWKEADYDADDFDRFPKGAGFPGGQSADWGWAQIILASLNKQGRAAIVLDTGAASRGSGNVGRSRERDVRRWFVENDLIEGTIYLPENLFYNTTAPGILLVLNKAKPKERQGKLFLLNATNDFTKGDPKNYLADEAVVRISATFSAWKEVEKYSQIVSCEEIAKHDFNISPSRYIHTGEGQEYRAIVEIIEELESVEQEAAERDRELKTLLKKLAIV